MRRLSFVLVIAAVALVSSHAFADPPVDLVPPQLPALPAPPVEGESPTPRTPAPRMKVETISNQATRTTGWVVLGSSLAVATGLFVGSLSREEVCMEALSGPGAVSSSPHCETTMSTNLPYLLGSFAVAAVGGTVGLLLITRDDEKKVTLSLGMPPASNPTTPSAMVPSGLVLRGRF